jgi:hypothetical protein
MTWIYAFPAWLFFIIAVVVLVGLACGGLIAYRRLVPQRDELAHNDVAGPIIGSVGTILAVVLSFLLIGNWQNYDSAAATMTQEAAALADLYHSAAYFPAPVAQNVRAGSRNYVDAVIKDEWPAMRNGGSSGSVLRAQLSLLANVAQYQPPNAAQQTLQQNAITQINSIADDRRIRLFDNDQGIPMIFWAGNFLLAAITIGLVYIFRVRNETMHVFMTAALAAVIATLFVITAEFDYPFRGDGQIAPLPFLHLQQAMADPSLDQAHGPR